MLPGFEFIAAGRIVFADGALDRLADISAELGSRALLVVGAGFARESGLIARIEAAITVAGVASCAREPHIEDVDAAVAIARAGACDMVVALGGGAVLDCGKAAAGMMTNDGSLADYLEGVGSGRQISQRAAPMIAVPTTSGTGSEVTKNAVISGPGYKKSVRSPLLIPAVALVDPVLSHSLPAAVTAACGMDALTQVIEPYLSRNANPMTDGLARVGIAAAARSLARAFDDPQDAEARAQMALASVLSTAAARSTPGPPILDFPRP
jgi:alcohol dehydrogenase class IV